MAADIGPWPPVSAALADYLDELYPEKCLQSNQTEAQAREYAGVRMLVNLLKSRAAILEDDDLTMEAEVAALQLDEEK